MSSTIFFRRVPALLFVVLFIAACRTPLKESLKGGAAAAFDANSAAREFFNSHYDFYYEDPSIIKALLAPRAFNLLKHDYELHTSRQEIGNLDCDPWINAQDGKIVEPFRFITVRNDDLEAVIRFDYMFEFAPKKSRPQSVIIKFQRLRSGSRWQLSDFIMPNNESLLDLLERKP